MHRIALNAAHTIALAKLQGKLEISKCAAVELALNKGLLELGVLSSEDYEIFDVRYKRKLVDIIAENKAKRENSHLSKFELEKLKRVQYLTSAQKMKADEQLDGINAALKGMYEQWNSHDLNWKIRTIKYAKKHPEDEYAKLLIGKEKECDNVSHSLIDGESAI